MDPVDATGPMRLVLCSFPNEESARQTIDGAIAGRLAACAQRFPIDSTYWWKGNVESAREVLVIFKTAPKRVDRLFRHIADQHPYDVPEIIELDVPRVHVPYLRYLSESIDPDAAPLPLGGRRSPSARTTRPGGRRAREEPHLARTRGRRPRR
jgi:periplasmic divalent cation tolerance protein